MEMTTYNDLLKQIETLQRQAEEIRRNELNAVIAEIKDKMAQYGLTAADLGGASSKAKKAVSGAGKVPAKYRNAATGETWSGRGRTPKWLADAEAAGTQREHFLVG